MGTLRQDFELNHFFKKELRKYMPKKKIDEAMKEIVRRTRERNNFDTQSKLTEEWHYRYDGESRWRKEMFDHILSPDERAEYRYWTRKEINSPYDCTGKWFTQCICICNTKERSIAYVFEGLDV